MFEGLIDSLNPDVWQESDVGSKSADFKEYFVNRNHKAVDQNTLSMMVALEDGDPVGVVLKDVLPNKDPLKSVAHVELLVNDHQIVGIDLNGDVVVRKDSV